jgi:hypothetical protein
MMGDASDEAMCVTRFFDDSNFELSELPLELYNFILHVEYLFLSEPAGCLATGYTYYATQVLQTPRLVSTSSGETKTIGGPGSVTVEIIGRCLSRMAGWARLSLQCISFEYPGWDLVLCYVIFNLSDYKEKHGFGTDFADGCIARLAKAMNKDCEELKRQMLAYVGFAKACYMRSPSLGHAMGWVNSIVRPNGRRLPEGAPLSDVIHKLQSWNGLTSSGVEQSFSKTSRCIGKFHENMSDSKRTDCNMLILDTDDIDDDVLITAARRIWCQTWKTNRSRAMAGRFSKPKGDPESLIICIMENYLAKHFRDGNYYVKLAFGLQFLSFSKRFFDFLYISM